MLIDTVIDYSDNAYQKSKCNQCNHKIGCPGNGDCQKCLDEIHFPNEHPNGKKSYDCHRLINFYVCKYSYKYASEILYLLKEKSSIKDIKEYNIMSIGCGPCPDLMAFETYCKESGENKKIHYYGVDINTKWMPIHNVIREKHSGLFIKDIKFEYEDAIKVSNEKRIENINVLILQYMISYLYNTNQINQIDEFFSNIIENVIMHRNSEEPFIIILNDVNSKYRGREYFECLLEKLKRYGFHGVQCPCYFDHNIKHEKQKYGQKHVSTSILYPIKKGMEIYNLPEHCSGAQMLIEVLSNDNKC